MENSSEFPHSPLAHQKQRFYKWILKEGQSGTGGDKLAPLPLADSPYLLGEGMLKGRCLIP